MAGYEGATSPVAAKDLEEESIRAGKALAALKWVFEVLRRDGDKDLLKIGAKAVSLFLDVWRDSPTGELRDASQAMAEACLGVLEAALAQHEPLIGQDFLEAMALLQYRAELSEAGIPDGGGSSEALTSVSLRSAAAFINPDNFLSCPPAELLGLRPLMAAANIRFMTDDWFKIPFHEVITQYRILEGAKAYCPKVDEVLKTAAGMHDIFPVIQELNLPWPASRSAKDLEAALGSDLRLVSQIAQAIRQYSGKTPASDPDVCWLLHFAKEAARVLLEEPLLENSESLCLTLMTLLDLGEPAADGLIAEARKFLAQQVSVDGCVGSSPPPGLPWHRIRPTWLAARALQPRSQAASQSWRAHFAKQGATLRYDLGHFAGPGTLEVRAVPMDSWDWLGVPDSRPGGVLPVVQPSAIGGEKGRGLFAIDGCRPVPLEFQKNPAFGDGGFLDEEVHERMGEDKSDGYDYIVLVTLGVWFRDDFTPGKLRGTVRPLSAVLSRWQKEGRCTQETVWNSNEQTYEMGQSDYTKSVFVALDTAECLASMANDKLLFACESQSVYECKDRTANNLVMVPCARPSASDPEKVEFSSVWVYPRWGWRWEAGKTEELLLGYGYEEPTIEEGA